MEPAYRLL